MISGMSSQAPFLPPPVFAARPLAAPSVLAGDLIAAGKFQFMNDAERGDPTKGLLSGANLMLINGLGWPYSTNMHEILIDESGFPGRSHSLRKKAGLSVALALLSTLDKNTRVQWDKSGIL